LNVLPGGLSCDGGQRDHESDIDAGGQADDVRGVLSGVLFVQTVGHGAAFLSLGCAEALPLW
jgi:hypothetical protein